ncbi:15287_t:CDS:2, partial [Funneliformis caledonium]
GSYDSKKIAPDFDRFDKTDEEIVEAYRHKLTLDPEMLINNSETTRIALQKKKMKHDGEKEASLSKDIGKMWRNESQDTISSPEPDASLEFETCEGYSNLDNNNLDTINFNTASDQYPFNLFVAWFGVCLIFLGVWLRWYAMRINRFFTRNLRIGEGQFIVTEGPYRHIRHPGYLGQLLIWNGFGLSSGNYLVASIIFIVISITYWFRIRKEEVSLLRTFGVDYLEYSTRVSKLIPHIY